MSGSKLRVWSLAVLVGLSACGGSTLSPSGGSRAGSDGQPSDEEAARNVQIYSAVVRQLVTKDHTFGGEDPPIGRIFIVDGVVRGAGDSLRTDEEIGSRFTAEERAGHRGRLARSSTR